MHIAIAKNAVAALKAEVKFSDVRVALDAIYDLPAKQSRQMKVWRVWNGKAEEMKGVH